MSGARSSSSARAPSPRPRSRRRTLGVPDGEARAQPVGGRPWRRAGSTAAATTRPRSRRCACWSPIPTSIAPRLDECLFADEVNLEAYRAVVGGADACTRPSTVTDEAAADLLQRLAVEDTEADPADVVARLVEEAALREHAMMQIELGTADEEVVIERAARWRWIKLRIEELHDPTTSAAAVEQLLAWLATTSAGDSMTASEPMLTRGGGLSADELAASRDLGPPAAHDHPRRSRGLRAVHADHARDRRGPASAPGRRRHRPRSERRRSADELPARARGRGRRGRGPGLRGRARRARPSGRAVASTTRPTDAGRAGPTRPDERLADWPRWPWSTTTARSRAARTPPPGGGPACAPPAPRTRCAWPGRCRRAARPIPCACTSRRSAGSSC